VAAKKYPQNRMLGWREFVDGKVFLWHSILFCVPCHVDYMTRKLIYFIVVWIIRVEDI